MLARAMAADWHRSANRPGFFSARAIAEAGYIYGLPLVMNYGVMNDFVLNRKSGQWKAPPRWLAMTLRCGFMVTPPACRPAPPAGRARGVLL